MYKFQMHRYKTVVVRSLEEFEKIIEEYLEM
jgi:hypothetical protein